MNRTSWVVGNRVSGTFLGVVEKARELSAAEGEALAAILVCPALDSRDIGALASAGADMIYHISADSEDLNSEEGTVSALVSRRSIDRPRFILFESSVFTCSAAPRLASRLGCGINADCTALEAGRDGELIQIRTAFGGRKLAYNVCLGETSIATVRRGVYRGEHHAGKEKAEVLTLPVEKTEPVWKLESVFCDGGKRADLTGADIIVSGGLGLGTKENFAKLYKLADNLGAQVGASRAAVAAGFAGYEHQVGQTGLSVRPDIYLAFGISGAVQHLSGITGAGQVFAVNTDPKAPIHEHSDFSLICDCVEVIDRLIELTGK